MKKTLCFTALAVVMTLSSWLPSAEAVPEQDAVLEQKVCWASEDLGGNGQDGYGRCSLLHSKSCSTANAWMYCTTDDDGGLGVCICEGSPLRWNCGQ